MAILHMNTEEVENEGRRIMMSATDMLRNVDDLRNSVRLICDFWEGSGAENINYQMSRVVSDLEENVNQLDELSRRLLQEERQWRETDNQKFSLSNYYQLDYDWKDLPKDLQKVGGALYIISALHKISPLRPNSVPIHGSKALLKAVGFGPFQRIMKPNTILKQFLKSSSPALGGFIAGVTDGVFTGIDTFLNSKYSGTSRALPAAVTDGLVKGIVTGVITAGLIALTTAVTAGAAPIVAAAGVIGICVIGGLVIDKFIVDPVFKAWQNSQAHDQLVETVTRAGNKVSSFFDYQARKGILKVRSAFSGFINALKGAPVPA